MREMTETSVENGVGIGSEFALFGDDGFFGIGWLYGGGNGRRRYGRVYNEWLNDFASEMSDCSRVGLNAGRRMEKW